MGEPHLRAAANLAQVAVDAVHAALRRVATSKALTPAGVGREVVLAWLAAACYACEERTAGGEKAVLRREHLDRGPSDAFALGVAAVALHFAAPVLDKFNRTPGDILARIGSQQIPALRHRLGTLWTSRRLAPAPEASAGGLATSGAAGVVDRARADVGGVVALSRSIEEPPSFLAESFYIAVRAMQVSLLPAVYRTQELSYQMYQALQRAAGEPLQGAPPKDSPLGRMYYAIQIGEDCQTAALLMERLAATATGLLTLALHVARAAVAQADDAARQAAASLVPEAMLRDVINYAVFVINAGAPDLFAASKDLPGTMRALSVLLQSDCISSAMTLAAIVDLLRAMLQASTPRRRGRSALAPPPLRPGAAALTEAVYQTVASAGVVPALMVAYSEASVVAGLDVDKYHFDKFTFRHGVDSVLKDLWRDDRCQRDLVAMAAPGDTRRLVLLDFLKALLNDLSYLLDDSLDRIADVQSINTIQRDKVQWGALSERERETRATFKSGQIGTAQGFVGMGVMTLAMLLDLAAHAPIRALLVEGSLPTHSAYICLHLLDRLVGARDVSVATCTDVKWDPRKLVADLVSLLLLLSRNRGYVEIMATEATFNEDTMRSTLERLREFESFMQLPPGAIADFSSLIEECGRLRAAEVEKAEQATAGQDLGSLAFPDDELEENELQKRYQQMLAGLSYGTFDKAGKGAYMYELARKAATVGGSSRPRQKRIVKELRSMQSEGGLPLHASAAIFVRQDEDRFDVIRACLTGPEGTPYAGGLFFFDVLYPEDYPNDAPLILLETTGGGRVRFNPNLYADGKVCLSLLGTFHGSQDEKWSPESSTLWQILVSIQSMVLVEDPYFNEPNVETMRHQAEGISASKKRNAALQLDTLRWAMIDVLRNPRPGFDAAIGAHFKALRGRVMKQCRDWVEEAGVLGELHQQQMLLAVKELYTELSML